MIGPSVGKNLLELADELKNLSEQEIVMEVQNPQKYPQYLVFTELDRRNKMKAKYAQDQQGPPETTMIEERMMGIQTPPGGIGGAPQGPPQGPSQGPPQGPQGPPPGPPGPPPQAGPPPGAPGTPNMQAMMMAQGGPPGPGGMAHGGVVRGYGGGGLLGGIPAGPLVKAIKKGPLYKSGALGLMFGKPEKDKEEEEEEKRRRGMAHGGIVQPRHPRRGFFTGGTVLSYDEWLKGPGAAYAGLNPSASHSFYRDYQRKANEPTALPDVVSEATSAVRPDQIRDVSFTESVVEEAAPFSGSTRITSGGGPGSGSGIQPVNDPLESLLGSEVEEVEEGGGFMDTVGDYGSQAWDWAKENPLDAAAMGLMFVPGVGWVAGTGIKGALGWRRLDTKHTKLPILRTRRVVRWASLPLRQ